MNPRLTTSTAYTLKIYLFFIEKGGNIKGPKLKGNSNAISVKLENIYKNLENNFINILRDLQMYFKEM